MSKTQIGIIFGGSSVEHEISILSAMQVLYALDYNKYQVTLIYLTKNNKFLVGPNFDKIETFKKKIFKHYEVLLYSKDKVLYLKKLKGWIPRRYLKPITCILPIVHGKGVEDGSLAGFFNILKVPYASSDILTASIFQDKAATKKFLAREMIATVKGVSFYSLEWKKDVFKILEKLKKLSYPVIVKPANLGSSIGISICVNDDELIKTVNQTVKYDERIVVERKINNYRELNQAVLGSRGDYQLSEVEEIVSDNQYLTFNDKYKSKASKRIIPADISSEMYTEISNISLKIANIFQTKGVIRIDYLYDINAQKIYVNEVNSIPGSLSYYLFEGKKIYFSKLLDQMISLAIKDRYLSDLLLSSFDSNILSEKKILKK